MSTASRFELSSPRVGRDGKTYWTRVGVAFSSKTGDGFNVVLEAYPLPDNNGRVVMVMRPPRERGAAPGDARPSAPRGDLDDEIPF